jgi:hypothetical protein
VSNSFHECSTPPFSGVVGSACGRGVNVSSRVNRAGFTGTRGVLVSAVPSAGVGVAVNRMSAAAGEHAIGQRQVAANGTPVGAQLA